MHEMSIAVELLRDVLDEASKAGAVGVDEVEVRCGRLRLVQPESLQMAFEVVCEGTLAQGARLKVVVVELRAECRSCSETFSPAIDDFRCPACGAADVRLLDGNDILLTSITCRTGDETGSVERP